MIVAASTADGHAEESAAHRLELLIHDVHAQHAFVLLLVVRGAEGEETGGRELTATLRRVFKRHQITGQLLRDHAINGRVFADGLEDVVTKAPGILKRQGTAATGGFGKACDV